jgi:Glycosyltransferase family 87
VLDRIHERPEGGPDAGAEVSFAGGRRVELTRAALAACLLGPILFALACLVPRGGLLSDEQFVDVHLYRVFSERMLHGQLPYRDFFVEYPPGSIPVFAVPGWIAQEHYQGVFRVQMTLLGMAAVGIALVTLVRAGASTRRLLAAALALGLLPLALGPVLLNGYDLWPTLLAVAGLALLVAGRDTLACFAIGLAAIAKIFPVALLPLALLWAWRRGGRPALLRGVAAFVAGVVALSAFWVAIAPGGVGYSFEQQLRRGLQNESLGASFVFVLDKLGLYHARLEIRPPGSLDVVGPLGQLVGAATTLVEVAAIVLVVVLAARAPRTPETLLSASAAALCAFVAFGKVFSPQYLVWLLPFVPLVAGAAGAAATLLLAAAAGLTQLWVLTIVRPFDLGASIWLVILRNLLVAAAYGVVLVRLRRAASTA